MALKKVMAKEPKDRHQTAEELVQDLLRDQGPPAAARPAEPRGLFGRLFGRK